MDLKKLVNIYIFVSVHKSCYIKQDYSLQVTIPAGEHGEVSRRLSKTIANIREPPVYRDQTYFDPSTLFSSIQAKLVLTCDICILCIF